ncbi:MAG: 3-phosphoshikimate 1-carboxyvinyltransferase [Bacteroidota bacterium]|nr:3-phosphoshikimate 1-carboxyvinyltransferase [Bacteroidota bacterium]|tara:strand:- start:3978 stop:5210 length:1233 start_codon:yes stop_codon:yes gene_type:complete
MKQLIIKFDKFKNNVITLNSSKSESNRLLIIQALSKEIININNLSNANDTIILKNLLNKNSNSIWNIEDAGTTMRFLTSFLSLKKNEVKITGSKRMEKRPIAILVNALNEIGAKIKYLKKEGYPPIYIKNKISQKINSIQIKGNISSQYISSLLLIAPILKNGIKIKIVEPFYSKPYVEMTLSLMKNFGIKYKWNKNKIKITNQKYLSGSYKIESDWSAASYWYSIVSINDHIRSLKLIGLRKNSFQGDKIIADIMKNIGVYTRFERDGISLIKNSNLESTKEINFKNCPDLAQTILVIAAVKKIKLKLKGLESLKIKETDRLIAMKKELKKIGCNFYEANDEWILEKRNNKLPKKLIINTYKDHRVAMSFASLSSKLELVIRDPEVVNKSYPNFWNDLESIGYVCKKTI